MDLSKAYDCIPHDLIAKLHAYGLGIKAIKLLHSYLTNRKQRTKINNSFSEWVEIVIGIPQGSVLGPLLFNIFINDLLLGIEDGNLCNFADDNTLYTCCESLNEAKFLTESQCSLIIDWFKDNILKIIPEECQVIILGQKAIPESFSVEIDNVLRKPVPEVTLLGVTLHNKLNFNSHASNTCKEASKKLSTLLRAGNWLNHSQNTTLINYCHLVWMFCSKEANNEMEKLHKRPLQIIHDNFSSFYDDLRMKDNSATIHVRNLQFLMTEIFKTIHDKNPLFMKEIFVMEESCYNLRSTFRLHVPRASTTKYGLETISFRGIPIVKSGIPFLMTLKTRNVSPA